MEIALYVYTPIQLNDFLLFYLRWGKNGSNLIKVIHIYVCLALLRFSPQASLRSIAHSPNVPSRTKGVSVSSVKLFGWAVLWKIPKKGAKLSACSTHAFSMGTFFFLGTALVYPNLWECIYTQLYSFLLPRHVSQNNSLSSSTVLKKRRPQTSDRL